MVTTLSFSINVVEGKAHGHAVYERHFSDIVFFQILIFFGEAKYTVLLTRICGQHVIFILYIYNVQLIDLNAAKS